MARIAYVEIEHDQDADMSWLEQDMYDPNSPEYSPTYRTRSDMRRNKPMDPNWYRDPNNHVALCVIAYDTRGEVIDSLSGIDFLEDSDEWRTGRFYRLQQLPKRSYLRTVCKEMGLPRRAR